MVEDGCKEEYGEREVEIVSRDLFVLELLFFSRVEEGN